MRFSRFAQFAAALALSTIGFAAPVLAQNNKQIISGTWYEDRASANASLGELRLTFAQTPTNQFLNITNVSCNITLTASQVMSGLTLFAGTTSGAADLGRTYEVKGNVTPETLDNFRLYSIVTNQVFFKYGPGRFPSIQIDSLTTGTSSVSANCTIVGNLTDS
jgi:hypothetical protein